MGQTIDFFSSVRHDHRPISGGYRLPYWKACEQRKANVFQSLCYNRTSASGITERFSAGQVLLMLNIVSVVAMVTNHDMSSKSLWWLLMLTMQKTNQWFGYAPISMVTDAEYSAQIAWYHYGYWCCRCKEECLDISMVTADANVERKKSQMLWLPILPMLEERARHCYSYCCCKLVGCGGTFSYWYAVCYWCYYILWLIKGVALATQP